jgi:hypothetical protein
MRTVPPPLDTLRAAGPSRLAARALRRLRYGLVYPWAGGRLYPTPAGHHRVGLPCDEGAAAAAVGPGLEADARALGANRFALSGQPTLDFRRGVDWQAPGSDPLWRYTLHYGEWALTLLFAWLRSGRPEHRQALIRLLDDWIERNPVGARPGWEPYPISRRLCAWTRVANVLQTDPDAERFVEARLLPSLLQQARLLAANLERDLGNNHLIANYKALAWVGLALPGAPDTAALAARGLAGCWTELLRQVLADGAHDERSTSYHTLVLCDLVEVRALAAWAGVAVPPEVESRLAAMVAFLAALRGPDGSWPLLNDSVPGYPMDPRAALLAAGSAAGAGGDPGYAAWLGKSAALPALATAAPDPGPLAVFREAGYAVAREGAGEMLILDAGPMGPAHLPGHGHADALAISLWASGRPRLVDPGVSTYWDPLWRNRLRATAAHSTVTVDGQDQCVFWGPFRVAFAPPARLLDCSSSRLAGEHLGYRRLASPLVHRRQVCRAGRAAWQLDDWFEGGGSHDFALTLALAPGATLELSGSASGRARFADGGRLDIVVPSPPAGARATVEDGAVATGWNQLAPARRYVLRWRAQAPCACRVVLETA